MPSHYVDVNDLVVQYEYSEEDVSEYNEEPPTNPLYGDTND